MKFLGFIILLLQRQPSPVLEMTSSMEPLKVGWKEYPCQKIKSKTLSLLGDFECISNINGTSIRITGVEIEIPSIHNIGFT